MQITRATEWSWVLGAYLLLNLAFASFQPVSSIGNGLVYDGHHYYAMAEQVAGGRAPEAAAPFVYRVGAPVLVAALTTSGRPVGQGFDVVNLAANALSMVLLTIWLRRHVAAPAVRVLILVFFMVEPHAPVRFAYFYPINVDPAAVTFLVLGLIGLDWFRDQPALKRAVCMAVVVGLGVAVREVVFVIAVAMLFVPHTGSVSRLRTFVWLPLVSGALVLTAIQSWVAVTPSGYSILGTVQVWLRDKTLTQYVLAWFLVFGPLLVLPAYFAPATARVLAARPDWLVYVLTFAGLAWVGGSDTERILVFAGPVIYVLIANALSLTSVALISPLMTGLVLMQLLSSRIFLPIGTGPIAATVEGMKWNRLMSEISWLSTYESLWSLMLTRRAVIAYVVWYAAMAVGIVACLRFVATRRTNSAE